jgi:hypothetical protein
MTFSWSQYHFCLSSECESAHKDDFLYPTHAFSEQKLACFVHWGEADPTLSRRPNNMRINPLGNKNNLHQWGGGTRIVWPTEPVGDVWLLREITCSTLRKKKSTTQVENKLSIWLIYCQYCVWSSNRVLCNSWQDMSQKCATPMPMLLLDPMVKFILPASLCIVSDEHSYLFIL